MSTTPEPGAAAPFTYEELADLQAGVLTETEKADLRLRIQHHPQLAQRMLAALNEVDQLFPDPPDVDAPLDVPPGVLARWQLAIAREAEWRARTDTSAGLNVVEDPSHVDDDNQDEELS